MNAAKRSAPIDFCVDPNETPSSKKLRLTTGAAEPVRLCAIYLRDLFAFLPRGSVEKLREVSVHLNEAVLNCPSRRLPRGQYKELLVMVEAEERVASYMYKASGFLPKCELEPAGRIWHQAPEFTDCCRELKDAAEALVGKHLFHNLPAGDGVYLIMKYRYKGNRYALRVRNRLTEETAFPALHFLSHLDECYFSSVMLDLRHGPPIDSTRPPMRLNAELLALLPGGRTGGKGWLRAQQLSVGQLPLALFIRELRGLIRTAEVAFQWLNPLSVGDSLLQLLSTITEGREWMGEDTQRLRIEPIGTVLPRSIDAFVKYFRDTADDLSRAIPEVYFVPNSYWFMGWPTETCPKEAGELVESILRTRKKPQRLIFHFANAHSPTQSFNVELESYKRRPRQSLEDEERIVGACFKFSH